MWQGRTREYWQTMQLQATMVLFSFLLLFATSFLVHLELIQPNSFTATANCFTTETQLVTNRMSVKASSLLSFTQISCELIINSRYRICRRLHLNMIESLNNVMPKCQLIQSQKKKKKNTSTDESNTWSN